MPRVKELKESYIEKDLAKILRGILAENDVTQTELASKLRVSQPCVSHKLSTGQMTAKDLIIILRTCNADERTIERIAKL